MKLKHMAIGAFIMIVTSGIFFELEYYALGGAFAFLGVTLIMFLPIAEDV